MGRRTEESFSRAISYFEAAIARDPDYAAAYSGLADCYSSLAFSFDIGSQRPIHVQPKARAASLRAIALDESLAEAHNSLAYVMLNYDCDWPGAESEFKRSLVLNPGYAHGHHWYAHLLLSSGRTREALAESYRALELDPLSPIMNLHLGWHYLYSQDYDRALDQLAKTLELDPNYGLAYWYRGLVYEQKGMYEDGLNELGRAKDLLKTNLILDADQGRIYAASGDGNHANRAIAKLKRESNPPLCESLPDRPDSYRFATNRRSFSLARQSVRRAIRYAGLPQNRLSTQCSPLRSALHRP